MEASAGKLNTIELGHAQAYVNAYSTATTEESSNRYRHYRGLLRLESNLRGAACIATTTRMQKDVIPNTRFHTFRSNTAFRRVPHLVLVRSLLLWSEGPQTDTLRTDIKIRAEAVHRQLFATMPALLVFRTSSQRA